MTLSDRPSGDLRTLAREPHEPAPGAYRAAVPPPKFAWKTRVLLPGAILLVVLLLIGYTAKDALWPAMQVRVVPVVVKSGGSGGPASGGATVQAPGWVEADPYPISVPALADGVVKEVIALEGHAV